MYVTGVKAVGPSLGDRSKVRRRQGEEGWRRNTNKYKKTKNLQNENGNQPREPIFIFVTFV